MAAVIRDILSSRLATDYRLDVIVTWDSPAPLMRVLRFTRALGRLARWCRGGGDRLVHVHTAVRGSIYRKAACVAVARAAGRPILLHLHAGAGDIEEFAQRLGPLRRALLSRAVRMADVVVSVSEAGAHKLEDAFGAREIVVIPNAAPPARPVTVDKSPADPPRALYIGGFGAVAKGGRVLVEALPRLLDAHPSLEVALAGTGEPPAPLAALVRDEPRVSWDGWLDADAKAERLARADVFVMPSLSEGMPVALLEAMSYGCAIVASDVGGIPDVARKDSEAILVPADDPIALADAVARVGADAELRDRLGAAARERVKDFDRDAIYGRFAAVYDSLLERSPGRP